MTLINRLAGLLTLCPCSKARSIPAPQRAEELCECHAQSVRQPANHIKARRPLATFDSADVGPVQASALGKFLLGEFAIASELADAATECEPEVFHEPRA